MEGWIKIHRKMLDWEWYQDPNTLRLFIHLMLKANHKSKTWKGVKVSGGQVITGRQKLSEQLNLSQAKIKTSLKKLKKTQEITIQTTNRFSLVTLVNWSYHQDKKKKVASRRPNKKPTNEQPIATNKKERMKELKKYFITKVTLPVTRENQFEGLYEIYGYEGMIEIIDRAAIYWKRENKKRRYRMAKRWNKFYENIDFFTSEENLQERIKNEIEWEEREKNPKRQTGNAPDSEDSLRAAQKKSEEESKDV